MQSTTIGYKANRLFARLATTGPAAGPLELNAIRFSGRKTIITEARLKRAARKKNRKSLRRGRPRQ